MFIFSAMALSVIGCSRPITGNKEADNGLKAFNEVVKAYPQNKGYHSELQHWGFKLPTGEKFEWSKDMSANKLDFAMIMLAEPLIKAELDVNKLQGSGWIFREASNDNMGMGQNPDQIVKIFDINR